MTAKKLNYFDIRFTGLGIVSDVDIQKMSDVLNSNLEMAHWRVERVPVATRRTYSFPGEAAPTL